MGKIQSRKHYRELRKTDLRHARELRKSDNKLHAAILTAMNTAVTKQETADQKRADASNEIRGAMMDQQRGLMPRPEATAAAKTSDEKIAALQDAWIARQAQGVGASVGWGWAVAVVMLALAVYMGLKP